VTIFFKLKWDFLFFQAINKAGVSLVPGLAVPRPIRSYTLTIRNWWTLSKHNKQYLDCQDKRHNRCKKQYIKWWEHILHQTTKIWYRKDWWHKFLRHLISGYKTSHQEKFNLIQKQDSHLRGRKTRQCNWVLSTRRNLCGRLHQLGKLLYQDRRYRNPYSCIKPNTLLHKKLLGHHW